MNAVSPDLTIRGVWTILKRRRLLILKTVFVFFLLGLAACFFLKPRYRATAEIEIQKSATDSLGLANLSNSVQEEQSDALDANITQQTEATILQSDSLALKVIKDLQLEQTKDFAPSFNPIGWLLGLLTPDGISDQPRTSLEDSPHRREHALRVFAKHLKVTPVAGTRLIDIRFTSSDPKIAAAVANDLAKSLVDYTINSRYLATSQVSGWLTNQLGEIKKDAEQQQGKVEQLQRDSGVYSLGISDAQGKEIAYSSTLDRLQRATQDLSDATSNRILKGALFKTIENGDPELISGLAGSSLASNSPAVNNAFQLIQTLRAQQASLSTQLALDRSKYGSANPKLVDDQATLDSINAQIASEVQRIGTRAENDYRASQAVEDKMRTIYDQERDLANTQNDKAIALLIARQEAADSRSLYQTLYSHLKEAGVVEGMRSSNIALVDPGRVPARPAPDLPICLALSLVCGCFVGASGALVKDATNDRIETMSTVESALNAPILAMLPRVKSGAKAVRLLPSALGDDSTRIEVLGGPNSAYTEALRDLRTSLLRVHADGARKTILLTSGGEQEGKSTVSLNLAALLALNGARVLLVDADMRSAGLSQLLGLGRAEADRATKGLSEALEGDDVSYIVSPVKELPDLSFLPAGALPNYPAELLGKPRMAELVKQWQRQFNFILLDSPPVLAVTDARILSPLADTTLLVARHGRSTQRSLERAYEILHGADGHTVGVVINGVQHNSVSYSEFHGYHGTSYYKEA